MACGDVYFGFAQYPGLKWVGEPRKVLKLFLRLSQASQATSPNDKNDILILLIGLFSVFSILADGNNGLSMPPYKRGNT